MALDAMKCEKVEREIHKGPANASPSRCHLEQSKEPELILKISVPSTSCAFSKS